MNIIISFITNRYYFTISIVSLFIKTINFNFIYYILNILIDLYRSNCINYNPLSINYRICLVTYFIIISLLNSNNYILYLSIIMTLLLAFEFYFNYLSGETIIPYYIIPSQSVCLILN